MPFLLAIAIGAGALFACTPAAAQPAARYRPGEVIVKYRPGARTAERFSARGRVGAQPLRSFEFIGAELLSIGSLDVNDAVARLRADASVEYAEPNYELHALVVPNDPQFPQMYALQNTGQTGGTPGADIHATQAWDIFTGDQDLKIGVIDTGVDYTHPDLAPNIWTNPGEIAGNGVDDDGNGYVDDLHGYDFVNNDGDPFDDHGHGTHVSGTIAAVGNNGVGVVGVNWHARIVGIKFLNAGGSGSTAAAISAVQYAIRVGVRLTSNSWGGGDYSQALLDAINAAGAAGQVFVAAAGNSSINVDLRPTYPVAYDSPYILGVAATDHNDVLASFSNWGPNHVQLAAPGVAILSTLPGGSYGLFSGTSMATPHVSGALGFVLGRFPGTSAVLARNLLLMGVDTLPGLNGLVATGGRLNLLTPVLEPDSIRPAPIADLTVVDRSSNGLVLAWTASGDDSLSGRAVHYDLRYSTAPITGDNFATAIPAAGPAPRPAGARDSAEVRGLTFNTPYYMAVKAVDEFGNASAISNVATGTTLGIPDITASPTSFFQELLSGATATQTLTLRNDGEGTLDWTAPLPELVFAQRTAYEYLALGKGEADPRGPVTEAAGGPDAFGYRWSDSDQNGGPAFAWVDITGPGTPLPISGDDATSPPMPMGMGFPFYGNTFASVRVSTNGYISFTDASAVFANQPLPNPGGAANMIAPFWDDLFVPGPTQVYTYFDGSRFIISWLAVEHYGGGGPYSFQVLLYPSGEIRLQYLSLYPPTNDCTVGIQNGTRTIGLTPAFNTAYLKDNLAIRISKGPEWLSITPHSGRLAAGETARLDVRFDSADLFGGDYHASLRIESNDPDEGTTLVPATMRVVGAPHMVVEGAERVITSVQAYAGDGASTSHNLPVLDTPAGGGSFELVAEGDYGDASEIATLSAEGRTLGQTGGTGIDCDVAAVVIPLDAATLASLASDGAVHAIVQNTIPVGYFCVLNRHTVRLRYRLGADSLRFGEVFIGGCRAETVMVRNRGTDSLRITGIDVTGVGFAGAGDGFTLGVGEARVVAVTFCPPGVGDQTGTLTIHSNDPDQPSQEVPLTGRGVVAPDIGVTPASLSTTLLSGASETQTLHVTNTGGSDLVLEITQATGGAGAAVSVPRPASWPRAAGEDASSRLAPAGYALATPQPHSASGSSVLLVMDALPWGSTANQVILDANGITYDVIPSYELAATDLGQYQVLMVASDQPNSTYSTLAAQAPLIEHYVSAGGTLEFHGCGWGWSGGDASQVQLPGGARLAFRLSDVNHVLLPGHPLSAGVPGTFTGTSASHGYLTSLPADALVVMSDDGGSPTLAEYRHGLGVVLVSTQTLEFGFSAGQTAGVVLRNLIPFAFHYSPPWLTVDPAHATVAAGGTLDVQVHIDSGSLLGGSYHGDVRIASNDPDEALVAVPVDLRVIGVPNIDVSPASLTFGTLFIGLSRSDTVLVANLGTDSLRVSSVGADDADYTVDGAGFVLAPGGRRILPVTFHPSRPGAIEATLHIASNDPDQGTVAVALHGSGLIAPVISVQPDSLSADLLTGQTATRTLSVSNSGGSPLIVTMKSVGRVLNAAGRHTRRYEARPMPSEAPLWVPSEPTANVSRPSSGPVVMVGDYQGTHLHFGVTDFGEIMPFQYPIGNEHLAWGSFLSGYTVAYQSQGFDNLAYAGYQDRFNIVPVSYRVISDSPAAVVAEVVTRTQDARLLITRTFWFPKAEKGVRIETQLKDLSGVGLGQVVFKEWADWDTDGQFDNVWDYDRTRNMVYAQSTHLTAIAGRETPDAMDALGWNDYAGRSTLVDLPAGPVTTDGLGLLHYELGDFAPTQTQSVVTVYGAGDNLAELQEVIDRAAVTGDWLSMDPAQFTVPAGSSLDVAVTFDPGVLLGGDYDAFAQLESNDPLRPVVQVPAHLHVTGVPNLSLEGAPIVLESVQAYSADGALTLHSLPVTIPPTGSGAIDLLAEGDYGDVSEQAMLEVEGRALGQVGGIGSDCSPASGTFAVDAATLAALAADGVITARVQNTGNVNTFCPTNRHTVRVTYRQNSDSLLFGQLFVGESRDLGVRVRNTGTDDLVVGSAVVTGTAFSLPGPSFPVTLHPGEELALTVHFAPAAVCACAGTLVITSNDPDQATAQVVLDGSAVLPPDIDVSPGAIVSTLVIPAQETRIVTIANPGHSDLVFTATPALAPAGPVAGGGEHGTDRITSTGDPRSNLSATGERYTGPLLPAIRRQHIQGGSVLVIADSGTEGDIGAVLGAAGYTVTQVVDDLVWNGTNPSPDGFAAVILLDGVDYGDDMPTAGQLKLIDYVQRGGGLILTEWISFEVESGRYQSMRPLIPLTRTSGEGGTQFFSVVQSHPVTAGVSPTFSVSSAISTGFANSGTVVVARTTGSSPITIVKEFGQGRIVDFATAGNYDNHRPFTHPDMQRLLVNSADWVSGHTWLTVSPASGTIPAGSHLDLSVLINSDGLSAGVYRDSIRIRSNDPDEPLAGVAVTLNASVLPDIDPLPAAMDFGTVFVGQGRTLGLELRNRGLAELEVGSATVGGDGYAVLGATFPIRVPPQGSRTISVRFEPPAVCAPCLGSITLASNDPDENPITVNLSAVAVLPPDIALDPLAIQDTVTIPNVHARTLNVRNVGASPLYLSFDTFAIADTIRAVPTWLTVIPLTDTIPAGGSHDIQVRFTTAGLLGGRYAATLQVRSNDPDESSLDLPVTLQAVGVPDIAVNQDQLEFGPVFTGYTRDLPLTLKNTGTDTLRVGSGTPGSAAYQLIGAAFPITLAPLGDAVLTVRFAPTVACDPCSTALVLRSNDPDEDPMAVPLLGAGVVPPDAGFAPARVAAAAATTLGDEAQVRTPTVRIANTGGSPLEFSTLAISAADTVTIYEPLEGVKDPNAPAGTEPPDPRPGILGNGGPDNFGYRWRDSDSPGGPRFDWVDITHTGTQLPMIGDDFFAPNVNIGFFFRYYGFQFRFVNVCTNGFVSFTSTSVQSMNQPLPSPGAPRTMLAPFWDDLDFILTPRAWVKREPSRFIVTWEQVPHHGGGGPYTFQLILYSSGRIVYQYLHMGEPRGAATVGFQNNLQNDGLTIAFNHPYIHDSLAVEIFSQPRWLSVSPASGSIPAGGSADIQVRCDADQLPDGNYEGSVLLHTNQPNRPTLSVPVDLHVGVVNGTFNVDPNALNRLSDANWISAELELPAGFDPHALDISTVRGQRAIPLATGAPYEFQDADLDGLLELRCKFDREGLMALLPDGDAVPVEAIGEIPGVTWVQALDEVRVMRPGMQSVPTANRVYEAGTEVLLEWQAAPDPATVHYDLWYSGNGGESWIKSAAGLTGQSYAWMVPSQTTDHGRLELVAIDAQGVRGSWLSGNLRILAGVAGADRPLPTELGLRHLGENPVRGAARLELALPARTAVELQVYDLRGASVRHLVARTIDPGWHTLEWDGRDDRGRRAGAGVYFLRLVADGKPITLRLALVH